VSTYDVCFEVPTDALPLGAALTVWVDGTPFLVTYVACPVRYCFVAMDAADEPSPAMVSILERIRRAVAVEAGVVRSPAIPKLAVVSPPRGDAAVYLRTRLADGQPWHPRMAASGLLALGVALTCMRTAPARIGGVLIDSKRVETPAGIRTIVRGTVNGVTCLHVPVTVLPAHHDGSLL
jgi:2-methylaconitate cis-trans-isomerase PrpF